MSKLFCGPYNIDIKPVSIIRVRFRLCINHGYLAIFSDILHFFYTISLGITRIIYKIRIYNVCHRWTFWKGGYNEKGLIIGVSYWGFEIPASEVGGDGLP